MDIWKAGDANLSLASAQARAASEAPVPESLRGERLSQARAKAQGAAARAESWQTSLTYVGAASAAGMIGSAVLAGCGLAPAHACSAAMDLLAGLALASIAAGAAASLLLRLEEGKAECLARFERATALGQGVEEAIERHLGCKLAAKLGGWRDESAAKACPSKARLGR